VLTQAKKLGDELEARKADLAASTQAAIVDVLVKKPWPHSSRPA
jgi:N6-L-threonylcarbamoyladenine synthase